MKAKQNYFTALLILILAVGTTNAQDDIYENWGPDTNAIHPEFETYDEIIDYLYEGLNQDLTTDILSNRTPDISRRNEFDGKRTDVVGDRDEFYTIYTEMTASFVDGIERPDMLLIDSVSKAEYIDNDIVNIGLMRYQYNEISPEAIQSGKVYWDGYQCKVARGLNQIDPFVEKEVAMLAPLLPATLEGGNVTVMLDYPYIFSNITHLPMLIEIDFGDGMGYKEVSIGAPIEIHYPHGGYKQWSYRLMYEDGFELVGVSGFSTRSEDPLLEYECGEGALIMKGTTIRDLPDHVIGVEATQVIPNKKNDNGLVAGQMGIYYGCGNYDCELKKPFIYVSGYGPHSDLLPWLFGGYSLSTQKTLHASTSADLLYNHVNGIFGEQGEGANLRGGNNGTNLFYKLRNEGYDIVVVYFNNGVDFVQNHAALVQKVILTVNQMKAESGSRFENIVLGQSMGGISTRYALSAWEKTYMQEDSSPYMHHHTKLWISWDGEMQGATVPLGLQFATRYLTKELVPAISILFLGVPAIGMGITPLLLYESLSAYKEILNNPAAKSMLTYHAESNSVLTGQTLVKHPYHQTLYTQLEVLGNPSCRRVGIANGSSTGEFPLNIPAGTDHPDYDDQCLMDSQIGFPFSGLQAEIGLNIRTEKVGSTVNLFKASFKLAGIPIAGSSYVNKKEYLKAESIAPGAFERFYAGIFYKMTKYMPWSCKIDDYRVPFVPTTSALDIQVDESDDFSYMVSDNLFYREYDVHDEIDLFGYPHNNPIFSDAKEFTPFDACFASQSNEFHLQNPSTDIRDFILLEALISNRYLQNRHLGASGQMAYDADFEDREYIICGDSVHPSIPPGKFIADANSRLVLKSPKIVFRTGTKIIAGAKLYAISTTEDPVQPACFQFSEASFKAASNTSNLHEDETIDEGDLLNQGLANQLLKAYPNPYSDAFFIEIDPRLLGSTLTISDVSGRLVDRFEITSLKTTIAGSSLPAFSLITITADDYLQSLKLIKQ